jgi:hypothetical protein
MFKEKGAGALAKAQGICDDTPDSNPSTLLFSIALIIVVLSQSLVPSRPYRFSHLALIFFDIAFGNVHHFLGFEAGFLGCFITLGLIKVRRKQSRGVLGPLNIFLEVTIHHEPWQTLRPTC